MRVKKYFLLALLAFFVLFIVSFQLLYLKKVVIYDPVTIKINGLNLKECQQVEVYGLSPLNKKISIQYIDSLNEWEYFYCFHSSLHIIINDSLILKNPSFNLIIGNTNIKLNKKDFKDISKQSGIHNYLIYNKKQEGFNYLKMILSVFHWSITKKLLFVFIIILVLSAFMFVLIKYKSKISNIPKKALNLYKILIKISYSIIKIIIITTKFLSNLLIKYIETIRKIYQKISGYSRMFLLLIKSKTILLLKKKLTLKLKISNKKFQNIILLLTTLIIVSTSIEICSFLLLKYSKKLQFSFPYFNRQISPYYVYENSPGFKYNTIKSNNKEHDAIIDKNGFICGVPISKQKDTNTIRVFITGGSGPFGGGQSKPYEIFKPYPIGVFSFESSIAGLLQEKLKMKFPNKNIEVINACCYNRMLHQSIAYYLETISEFNPDFVVSIDGQNDLGTMYGFSPYFFGSLDFSNYIELYEITQLNKDKSSFNFINLINTLKILNLKNKEKPNKKNSKDNFLTSNYKNSTYKEYLVHKNKYIQSSERFIKLIKYYHSLCKTDNVKFIFCLQPMLYREKFNKSLSLTEKEMQKNFFQSKLQIIEHEKLLPVLRELIVSGSSQILKYFIDDYLSGRINQASNKYGFSYIDMNKEIMSVPSNIEFYVDYCHLTRDANDILAEILFKKITIIMDTSNSHNKKL